MAQTTTTRCWLYWSYSKAPSPAGRSRELRSSGALWVFVSGYHTCTLLPQTAFYFSTRRLFAIDPSVRYTACMSLIFSTATSLIFGVTLRSISRRDVDLGIGLLAT